VMFPMVFPHGVPKAPHFIPYPLPQIFPFSPM
jgi:hypothetical protein